MILDLLAKEKQKIFRFLLYIQAIIKSKNDKKKNIIIETSNFIKVYEQNLIYEFFNQDEI
jgi:hypothetical protein